MQPETENTCTEILAIALRLESRVELLHQETRQTAETVTRIKLALDNLRQSVKAQAKCLDDIVERLDRIENLVARRSQ